MVVLIGILAAVLLPVFSKAREASRRASCQNNLKQIGLVCKMFANESKGEVFPPLSRIPNNWMMDMDAVYPEYVTDAQVFICPDSPFAQPGAFDLQHTAEHPNAAPGAPHPDCVWSLFYVYTGWIILFDDQALAFIDAYYERPRDIYVDRELVLDVPVWNANGSGAQLGPAQSGIPIAWDRVPLVPEEWAHQPDGSNVLYMDGHVEFQQYAYDREHDHFPVSPGSAEAFGADIPYLSSDCYGS